MGASAPIKIPAEMIPQREAKKAVRLDINIPPQRNEFLLTGCWRLPIRRNEEGMIGSMEGRRFKKSGCIPPSPLPSIDRET
jgi:hypothetical protein